MESNTNVASKLEKLKEATRLKWQVRKNRSNAARRAEYATTKSKRNTKNKRKRKLSGSYDTAENDILSSPIKKKKYINVEEHRKDRKRDTYDDSNITDNRCAKRVKYNSSKEERKLKKAIDNRKYYRAHKTSIIARQKTNASKKIVKKYNTIRTKFTRTAILLLKEYYVTQVAKTLGTSEVKSRMEAEWIIKWCYYVREKYICEIKTALESIKEKVEVCLTQLSESMNSKIEDKISVLCGHVRKHTVSSEAYFAEAMYKQPLRLSEAIIMNKNGQAMNILPIHYEKKGKIYWDCSSRCNDIHEGQTNTYYQFILTTLTTFSRSVISLLQNVDLCFYLFNF